jgi:hypothetical protein
MQSYCHTSLKDSVNANGEVDLKEIVMGLYWHPQGPGASCHVSERVTEREWIRLDLTALGKHREHWVATLCRSPAGWQISPDAQAVCAPHQNPYGKETDHADL